VGFSISSSSRSSSMAACAARLPLHLLTAWRHIPCQASANSRNYGHTPNTQLPECLLLITCSCAACCATLAACCAGRLRLHLLTARRHMPCQASETTPKASVTHPTHSYRSACCCLPAAMPPAAPACCAALLRLCTECVPLSTTALYMCCSRH
jgi:hypothetical protein